MKSKSLDFKLAYYCAPTLLGIKPANTLWLETSDDERLQELLHHRNCYSYQNHDLTAVTLYTQDEKNFYLMYSKELLFKNLKQSAYQQLLQQWNYPVRELEQQLLTLQLRFTAYHKQQQTFPHELSCFLGYPPADIDGYLKNQGRNYLFSGYWKVYHNPEKARTLFGRYDMARRVQLECLKK